MTNRRVDRRTPAEKAYDDYVDPLCMYREPWGADDDAAHEARLAYERQEVTRKRDEAARMRQRRDCTP